MKISGEITCQSWLLLTPFFNLTIVHWETFQKRLALWISKSHLLAKQNAQNWESLSSGSRSQDSTLVTNGKVKESLRLWHFYFGIIQKWKWFFNSSKSLKAVFAAFLAFTISDCCSWQEEWENCENCESSNQSNFWRRLPLGNGLFSLGKQFHGRLKTAGW